MARTYRANRTLAAFHLSQARVRLIRGPVGSGKSTACCWEIINRSRRQAPMSDGVIRTRWAAVRNTYRELLDTTYQTFADWFGTTGFLHRDSMTWIGKLGAVEHEGRQHPVEFELMFRALDRPDDVKKLLSLELTGAWVNEAREIPWAVIEALDDRVGRYPPSREGEPGPDWEGIFLDTNSPDYRHWWYRMAEEEPWPPGWEFFAQPGGMTQQADGSWVANPGAENTDNLPADYYLKRMAGKDEDHIRVYYGGLYGYVADGRPVVPNYVDAMMSGEFSPIPGRPLLIGYDVGGGTLQPAAVIAQRHPRGNYIFLGEVTLDNMGIDRFCTVLLQYLEEHFAGIPVAKGYADPSGRNRDEIYETVVIDHIRSRGLPCEPAPTNSIDSRIEAYQGPVGRLIDGKPGLMVHKRCTVLRAALGGRWKYRELKVASYDKRYSPVPEKDEYSHPADAGGYLLLGAGEHREIQGRRDARSQAGTRVAPIEFDPLSHAL
jgi:hypothetical protein